MMYDTSYLQSKDIDWFFKCGSAYVHIASAGGYLPKEVNNREKLRAIQYKVSQLPYLFSVQKIVVNEKLINQMLNNKPKSILAYVESFVDMARRGFVSLDRTNIAEPSDNRYHIVCRPPWSIQLKEIDLELPSVDAGKLNLERLGDGLKLWDVFGE